MCVALLGALMILLGQSGLGARRPFTEPGPCGSRTTVRPMSALVFCGAALAAGARVRGRRRDPARGETRAD